MALSCRALWFWHARQKINWLNTFGGVTYTLIYIPIHLFLNLDLSLHIIGGGPHPYDLIRDACCVASPACQFRRKFPRLFCAQQTHTAAILKSEIAVRNRHTTTVPHRRYGLELSMCSAAPANYRQSCSIVTAEANSQTFLFLVKLKLAYLYPYPDTGPRTQIAHSAIIHQTTVGSGLSPGILFFYFYFGGGEDTHSRRVRGSDDHKKLE